jgi:hypothetical protein
LAAFGLAVAVARSLDSLRFVSATAAPSITQTAPKATKQRRLTE